MAGIEVRLIVFLLVLLALRRKRDPVVIYPDESWDETEWATVWKR